MQRRTAVPFWRDVRVLTVLSQIVFVLVVVGLVRISLFQSHLGDAATRVWSAGFDYLRNTNRALRSAKA